MRAWRNAVAVITIIGLVVFAGVYLFINRQQSPAKIENRIPLLRKLVAEQQQESAQAVTKYLPKNEARINDLGISVAELLRQLPAVVQIEVGVQSDKPTCRIVHLLDRHFVPKDLYAIDMNNAYGRELSAEEIDQLHQELLLEVEAIQFEQMALLRCLIKHHSLKRIFSEGLSPQDMADFKEKVAVLRDMEKNQIPEIAKQLADVREMLKGMEAKTDRHEKTKKIEAELTGMLDQHKVRLLELGSPGRLLIAGEIEAVLPLEDADRLSQAKPISAKGIMKIDPAKLTARRDAQVKAVLDKDGFGLVVLGGSHDLSDSVRRLGKGSCEYLRITTKRFKEFSE